MSKKNINTNNSNSTISNNVVASSANEKEVYVGTSNPIAAFAKDKAQCYTESKIVLDADFIQQTLNGIMNTILNGIQQGVNISIRARNAKDARALWLKQNDLTAREVDDLLYDAERRVSKKRHQRNRRQQKMQPQQQMKPQQSAKPQGQPNVQKPQQQAAEQPRVNPAAKPFNLPDSNEAAQQPKKDPMAKLMSLIKEHPGLGYDLMVVLKNHGVEDYLELFK